MTQTRGRWRAWAVGMILLASTGSASAAGGPLGLGIIFGEPSGVSGKLFVDKHHAFDAALDFSFVDDAMYVHVDYLWHYGNIGSSRHAFIPYVGVGGKLRVDDHDNDRKHDGHDRLGARIPLGIAWMPSAAPIDVFLEIVPGLTLIPEIDPDVDAGLGVRYYF